MNNTLIIDGHNLAFRSYHLIRAKVSEEELPDKKDDIIFIFLNSFLSYLKMGNFTETIFTWDHKIDPSHVNFRKSLVAYKENRDHKDDLIFKIIDDIMDFTKLLGCRNILPKSLEADDIMFYISKNKPGKKFIVSSDKDILQLVDEDTSVYSPNKKIIYNADNFEKLVGMTTREYVIYKAIMGDVSDNIPGVPRYGEKKSTKLAKEWDTQKDNVSEENMEIINKNLEIMDLSKAINHCSEGEYEYYEEQLNSDEDFQDEKVKEFFRKKGQKFQKFLFNFHEWEKLKSSYVAIYNLFE